MDTCLVWSFRELYVNFTALLKTANPVELSMLQNSVSGIINMNAPTVANNPSTVFHSLSVATPRNDFWNQFATFNAIEEVFVFIDIGLVIFGTIGNIMTLAVFRMYQRSSKSSAIFLMKALCVTDTCYLLCSLCDPTSIISFYMRNLR